MDKIDVNHWDRYFNTTEQRLLYNSDRYTHFKVKFEQDGHAAGEINTIDMPGMLFTEMQLKAERSFCLYDNEPKEAAESVFVLQGNVESRFCNIPEPVYFSSRQHNIQYNANFSGMHVIHSPQFHACTITYHEDYLKTLVESEPNGALSLFSQQVYKKAQFLGAADSLHWQQRMSELIMSIRQCPFQGITRYIFTESKLMELFVLQMEQVHAIRGSSKEEEYWSPADKEKLYAVKEFITKSYLEPLSLKALAARFGLNEYKLKKGYKHFFQTTVFGDIQRLRMLHARQLLAERAMNVTEAAYYMGYSDLSSFSYAFKKTFGYNPGRVATVVC